ncbi:MAG TPA: ribbon-helix-helix protein, CopG family [Woeseiaceae bacterium]
MSKTKIATLNLRIDPAVKDAVREAAELEHRSVANMIEVLIRRYCDQAGIDLREERPKQPGNLNG